MSDQSRLQHTHQYVGKKIRRIRWQKLPHTASIPEKFATSTWDEFGPNCQNEIVLWHLTAEEIFEKRPGQHENGDDDRISVTTQIVETDWKFVRSAGMKVDSNINELQFLNEEHLIHGTGNGDVVVSRWFRCERKIRPVHTFQRVHGEGEGCVGFSLFGNDVVSLGSNGTLRRMDMVNLVSDHPIKGDNGNGSTFGPLTCLEHFGANEIVTGSSLGHLQIWDIRQATFFQLPAGIHDSGAVTAVRSHPSQRHILVAGYQSGNVAFWDLRNGSFSMTATAFEVHRGPIWELAFHPIYPSHLYSACNDGLLLHWDASNIKLIGDNYSISPWSLPTDQLRDHVKVTSLIPENTMPVNSLDVVGDSIVAGVDDESIWMIKNIPTL